MKKFFNKKILIISLGLLFLITAIPIITVISMIAHPQNSLAALIRDSYTSTSTVTTPNIVSRVTDVKLGTSTVINLSDKTLFIPNKSSAEWNAFEKNAPQYVSVSTCPNKSCGAGEDKNNCPADCDPTKGGSYCGDGVCNVDPTTPVLVHYVPPLQDVQYVQVCKVKLSGWLFVPVVNIIVALTDNGYKVTCNDVAQTVSISYGWKPKGEAWDTYGNSELTECKDDCAPPAGIGCGVCGYYTNAVGQSILCPNLCNDKGYNMINCEHIAAHTVEPSGCDGNDGGYRDILVKTSAPQSLKKYLTAKEALATEMKTYCADSGAYSYTVPAHYECDFGSDTSNSCPAGSYCPLTGGMKPGTIYTNYATNAWLTTTYPGKNYTTADLQKTCPAGSFCPAGSSRARLCPIDTYSTGATSTCAACPPGTTTLAGAESKNWCFPSHKAGDKVCNADVENPSNSPIDCPDDSQVSTGTTTPLWKGDGRCSGAEGILNSPDDCKCGDGICNNGETYLSCMPDCYGFDSVCGTTVSSYNASTGSYATRTYKEKAKATSSKGIIDNASSCKYMNYSANYPNDHTKTNICGDGICDIGDGVHGEGYINSIGKIACTLDCHCGDGSCNYSEFYSATSAAGSCNADCQCGNGTCNSGSPYYESSYNCMKDCHCGNHVCDTASPYSETANTCPGDCVCGDNICSQGESAASCRGDCFTCDYDRTCDLGELQDYCPDCGSQPALPKL